MQDYTPKQRRGIIRAAGMLENHLITKARDSGARFVTLKDRAADWMKEACCASHNAGGMLPDDHRYAFIEQAVEAIAACDWHERDCFDEATNDIEWADIYTHDRLAWLSSHLSRAGYCDEAVSDGLVDGSDIIETIGMGQYVEGREVFAQVLDALAGLGLFDDEDETAEEAVEA